jgi:cell division transport system ATP-binding protein
MIETFHVTKTYELGDRPALRDVSLRVDKGEYVFLTGPSGAGKSTLLKIIVGAEQPTSGQVLVNGRNVVKLKPRQVAMLRRQIGVVFQDFKLIATRTVGENVAFALRVQGLPEKEVRERVFKVLKNTGLLHKQHVFPQKLSGGEQQRVAVARAIVNDPPILLADEPTGNLDIYTTDSVMELLERANARGTTVIVATHDQSLMARYGKRIIYLDEGTVQAGPPRSWQDRPRLVSM